MICDTRNNPDADHCDPLMATGGGQDDFATSGHVSGCLGCKQSLSHRSGVLAEPTPPLGRETWKSIGYLAHALMQRAGQ